MAAKLQCEICGGKLIGRPGGVFECDSCGMEYDTAWAKAKIQEITGTVKVEGTVEVTGKVQVDGPVKVEGGVNKETLLQRGRLALEDGEWDRAKESFNQALTMDAEYADAWLGLAMTVMRMRTEAGFGNLQLEQRFVKNNPNYEKFLRFASPERAREITSRMEAAVEEKKNRENADAAAREAFRQKLPALRARIAPAQGMVVTTESHTVAMCADGSVLAAGDNRYGECDVSDWRDIVAIAVGSNFTIGLKADGTVVAAGYNKQGQCNVSDWKDMVAIAVGSYHTVGLREDGTVVATGENEHDEYQSTGTKQVWDGRCAVSSWENIVAIAAGWRHTVGLKADGTVVAAGVNEDKQCNVSEWKDIVAIAAGSTFTVGLKSDGSVVSTRGTVTNQKNACALIPTESSDILVLKNDGTVCTGPSFYIDKNKYGQMNVSEWREIIALAVGDFSLGLKADGTVIGAGTKSHGRRGNTKTCDWDLSRWENIVAISVYDDYAVGLKADGTLVTAGYKAKVLDVRNWKLFENLETLETERRNRIERGKAQRKAAREKAEAEREAKLASLEAEQAALCEELKNLKGLFTGKRRREIEARLDEISSELKKLG